MINYPEHLAMMGERARLPRGKDAPTVISTFAGGGGSSTGYHMAGFKELLAVEWDDNAVETLRLNYPDLDIYHGDIAKISIDNILQRTGLEVGELDVLDGSPPCQGFSTAGKRVMDDDRNQLFREFVRLIIGLQPKVFVMENVSGMVKGKMKLLFVEILKELKGCGYDVSARLLNAKYFHVPQSRQRLIFIGVRNDLGIKPSHPKAESREITVRDAILIDGVAPSRNNYGKGFANVDFIPFTKPSFTLRKTIAGGQHITGAGLDTEIAKDQPPPPLSDMYVRYWEEAKQGGAIGKFNSTKRLSSNKTAGTLSKSEGYVGSYHPTRPRGLSTGERKRLGSFPDSYIFTDWKNGVLRIGNSVPPLFMEAIARHIRINILDKIEDDTVLQSSDN